MCRFFIRSMSVCKFFCQWIKQLALTLTLLWACFHNSIHKAMIYFVRNLVHVPATLWCSRRITMLKLLTSATKHKWLQDVSILRQDACTLITMLKCLKLNNATSRNKSKICLTWPLWIWLLTTMLRRRWLYLLKSRRNFRVLVVFAQLKTLQLSCLSTFSQTWTTVSQKNPAISILLIW